MSGKALRVAIGPVQGFIASGRRTRDFWAGSFLLSWLSGVAMKSVIDHGGRITIPVVGASENLTEPTLRAIMAGAGNAVHPGPLVGTLVNHFRAEGLSEDFDISAISEAVKTRFSALAEQVFEVFIEPVVNDSELHSSLPKGRLEDIRARWRKQTDGSYFEILAVMGDDADWREESVWLERRKMFRSHVPLLAEKGADRCPIHGDLSELGGFSRQYEGDTQAVFWDRLRSIVGSQMYALSGADTQAWSKTGTKFRDTLEIRASERLSGLALVKRLFPLLEPQRIAKAIGWMPDHLYNGSSSGSKWNPAEAQRALRNWPSTAFVAAIPWIVRVTESDPEAAKKYAMAQYNALGANPIWEAERPQRHRVASIDELAKESSALPRFAVLDGTLHFDRGLEKHRFDDGENADAIAKDLKKNFAELRKNLRNGTGDSATASLQDGPASTHYAMLDMDGDSMGKVFSNSKARAERGSKALLAFSQKVPEVVRYHDGVLIYAGADDVNALLPIETAIACARAINQLWAKTFDEEFLCEADPCETPTLSGSIVFADYQNALDDVRRLTHTRLEEVAKDGMGRDALALAVMKSGGVVSHWASRWCDPDGRDAADSLFCYAMEAAKEGTVASRLPYLIRERYRIILEAVTEIKDPSGPSHVVGLFDDDQLAAFVKEEIARSSLRGLSSDSQEKAKRVVEILRPYYRDQKTNAVTKASRHVGGLLVARFLAHNSMWSYFDSWQKRRGETQCVSV